jgi:hypothetical protein
MLITDKLSKKLINISLVISTVLVFGGNIILMTSAPTKVLAATGCDMWDAGWREAGTGKTAEEVIGIAPPTTLTSRARSAFKQLCINTQDSMGITANQWRTDVIPLYRDCIVTNSQDTDFCNNEVIDIIPTIPGIASDHSARFRFMCWGRLGITDLRCLDLTTEVAGCISSGIDWQTCFDRSGRALDIYYNPSNCPPGNWSCGGKCASQATMQTYNTLWCNGETKFCGGASTLATLGCGSCAAGDWSCGSECAALPVRTIFNDTWADGQARWKYESGQRQGIACGGNTSGKKCVSPQVVCSCALASIEDDVCAPNPGACGSSCATAAGTSSASSAPSPLSDVRLGLNIPSPCAVTNTQILGCLPGECKNPDGTLRPASCFTASARSDVQNCTSCLCQGYTWSGIGCVNTTSVNGLVITIIRLVLGVIGGISLLLLISAGFLYSTGRTENLEKAKQRITAMFGAILFIVFSVLILRFIGVNILDVTTAGILG